jgi:hypothetical protein
MSGENPHVGRVVDLVNPYMTTENNIAGGGREAEGGEYAIWWLTTHPGRWALVAEGKVGIPIALLQKAGLRTSMTQKHNKANYKLYAQFPHPEGEDIREALARTAVPRLELPEIAKSDFKWTQAELADAVYAMRENLFPAEEGAQPEREPATKRGGARGRSPHARIR